MNNAFLDSQAVPLDADMVPTTLPFNHDTLAPYRPFDRAELERCLTERVQSQHLRRARNKARDAE